MSSSRILFVDTNNLNFSDYEASGNFLRINNFHSGLRSVNKIQLTSLSIPTYLLAQNSICVHLTVGDADDKLEVKREGDNYLYSSLFAKVYLPKPIQTLKINFFRRGVFDHGDEIILFNETYTPQFYPISDVNQTWKQKEIPYFVADEELLLGNIIIAAGSTKFTSTVSSVAGGFSFANGNADVNFTFTSDILYEFDFSQINSFSLSISFEGIDDAPSTDIQNSFISCLSAGDTVSTYHFFIPTGMFHDAFKFNFKFDNTVIQHLIEHRYEPYSNFLYEISIQKNGIPLLQTNILVNNNTPASSLNIYPLLFGADINKPPFVQNGIISYGSFLRISKGDAISYSLKPINSEYIYSNSYIPYKHMEANSKHIENLYSTLLFDKVEYYVFKQSDLMYTAPTADLNISNASSLNFSFGTSKGEDLQILQVDNIEMSLQFTRNE